MKGFVSVVCALDPSTHVLYYFWYTQFLIPIELEEQMECLVGAFCWLVRYLNKCSLNFFNICWVNYLCAVVWLLHDDHQINLDVCALISRKFDIFSIPNAAVPTNSIRITVEVSFKATGMNPFTIICGNQLNCLSLVF